MEISVEQFEKICRACLCESPNMRSLFTQVDGEQHYLLEVFASATNSHISLDDSLPKQVCVECEAIMCKAEAFRQRCNASAVILKNIYNASIKKVNIPEIDLKSIKCEINENINAPSNIKTVDAIDTSIQDCLDRKDIVLNELTSCFNPGTTAIKGLSEKDIKVVKIEYGDVVEPQDLFENDFDDREQLETLPIDFKSEIPEEKQKKYPCECGLSFKSRELYRRHKKSSCEKYKKIIKKSIKQDKSIPIKNQISCQSCNQQFSTVSSWKTHQKVHHNDVIHKKKVKAGKTESTEEFLCSLCSRKCKSAKSLEAHIRRHEENTNVKYTCEHCKREFKYKAFLDNHIVTVHLRDKGFTCEYCIKCFSTQESLESHREEHNTEKRHQCHICSKSFIMLCTLKDHMRTHTGEKPFLCSICGRGFSQKNNLAQHTRRHQGLKAFKCDQCEKRFVSKGELDAHKRKHTGAHPFVCDDCGNGFTTSSALVKHRRTHTGERPYACDLCPMRFAATGTLKNHRRTHTGERPFQCSHCEKAFVQRTDLISHIRCHTGERPYICNHCGHAFRKAAALKAHVRLHGKDPNMSLM